ncbi:hypothetical protein TorRG33x02_077770, partial [Trema orientale]
MENANQIASNSMIQSGSSSFYNGYFSLTTKLNSANDFHKKMITFMDAKLRQRRIKQQKEKTCLVKSSDFLTKQTMWGLEKKQEEGNELELELSPSLKFQALAFEKKTWVM